MLAVAPRIAAPIRPNVGIAAKYAKRLRSMVERMNRSILYWVSAAWRASPPLIYIKSAQVLAGDAAGDWGRAIRTVRGLRRRWQKSFDQAADEMAEWFATDAADRSTAAMKDILARAGFSVKFQMSAAVKQVLGATIQENVALIRSIPSQHFTQIEGIVMRSVQVGGDLQRLSRDLKKQFGVTTRRADFIAVDQNHKATAAITRAQQLDVGITRAVWMHSTGGAKPRPSHVAFSGKTYDVAKGAFLDGKWVWPGTEINCRCVCKPIVAGYNP